MTSKLLIKIGLNILIGTISQKGERLVSVPEPGYGTDLARLLSGLATPHLELQWISEVAGKDGGQVYDQAKDVAVGDPQYIHALRDVINKSGKRLRGEIIWAELVQDKSITGGVINRRIKRIRKRRRAGFTLHL